MPKKYFDVHYRKASGLAQDWTDLETAIRAALGRTDAAGQTLWLRAQDRIMDITGQTEIENLLFNTPADAARGVAGEMCLYRRGAVQPVLAFERSKVRTSDLTIAEIFKLLEEKAPAEREFITGVCYWLVIGNHVLFVTLRGFPKDYLLNFFAWLISPGESISLKLSAELDPAEVAGNLGRIGRFVVRGSNGSPKFSASPASTDGQMKVKKGRRAVPWDKAEQAIALTIGDNGLAKLKDSLTQRNSLFAETEWGVLGPRGKKLKETLSDLASAVADATDGEISVVGRDGEIKNGSAILKVRLPFDVEGDGHYLLHFDDTVAQLNEAYRRFAADGKLDT